MLFGFVDRRRKFSDSAISQIFRDRFVKMLKEDLVHVPEEGAGKWGGKKYRSRSTGEVYDFALHDTELWAEFSAAISRIESKVDREWKKRSVVLRDTLTRERDVKGDEETMYTDEEIEEIIEEERTKLLYSAIREESSKIPVTLLLRHLDAMEIVKSATAKAMDELQAAKDEAEKLLRKNHPIRSNNYQWLHHNVGCIVEKQEKMVDRLPEVILEELEKGGFKEEHYLLSKSLEFKAEKWEGIKADLAKVLVPSYVFEFHRYYWSPSSWEITRTARGEFIKKDHATWTVSSSYPFWRIINSIVRMGTWTSNGMLGLIVSMWCSPVSIRALFKLKPFHPYKRLDSKTGEIVVDTHTTVKPFFYLLGQIWKNVFDSRRSFEEAPDSGFLGKSVTRFFNIIWTYGFGVLGSAFLTATMPTAILLNVCLCLALLAATPVWGPALPILGYLFSLFVYDIDTNQVGAVLGWVIGVISNIFKIAGSTLMLVLIPIVSSFICLVRSITNTALSFSDWLFFHLVLARLARLPDRDGFLIRRISGPGMRSEYSCQISPEIVVLALHSSLEKKELSMYQKFVFSPFFQFLVLLLTVNHHIKQMGS